MSPLHKGKINVVSMTTESSFGDSRFVMDAVRLVCSDADVRPVNQSQFFSKNNDMRATRLPMRRISIRH